MVGNSALTCQVPDKVEAEGVAVVTVAVVALVIEEVVAVEEVSAIEVDAAEGAVPEAAEVAVSLLIPTEVHS